MAFLMKIYVFLWSFAGMYHPGKTPLAGQTTDWQVSARFGDVFFRGAPILHHVQNNFLMPVIFIMRTAVKIEILWWNGRL